MRKTNFNLGLLISVMTAAVITSNVAANRLIDIGIGQIPGGVLCFAVTFLVSDVINEIWGKDTATKAVLMSIVAQITATALFVLTGLFPCKDSMLDSAYNTLLGGSVWFTFGGLTAYAISQFLDVRIFQKLREKKSRMKWLRNNVSTMASQAVDSFVFILIGFGIGCGWIWNGNALTLLEMFGVQILAKIVLAALDTPLFYLLTRRRADE